MKTLIDGTNLQARIADMATEIDGYYRALSWYQSSDEPVVVIGVLTGALFFMADLVRKLSIRTELGFIGISSYPGNATVAQEPKITAEHFRRIQGRQVLIIDDILDTGKTLNKTKSRFKDEHPIDMCTAVLLKKPISDVSVDFVGFDIEDEWVAGHGMDDRSGLRREVPCIFVDSKGIGD